MVKVNVGGCSSFVKDAEYQNYVNKALAAFDTLQNEDGAGNDFLGWKTLPVDIPEKLVAEFEAIREGLTGTFFQAGNARSLANAIQRWLLIHADQRTKVRWDCYAEIAARWTPQHQIEVLKQALGVG